MKIEIEISLQQSRIIEINVLDIGIDTTCLSGCYQGYSVLSSFWIGDGGIHYFMYNIIGWIIKYPGIILGIHTVVLECNGEITFTLDMCIRRKLCDRVCSTYSNIVLKIPSDLT